MAGNFGVKQMDLSGLERLGKIAGIGGISVGAVVLLLNALVGTLPGLPLDQRADIVRLVAFLGFELRMARKCCA
jgi:hypothetical protein